MGWIVLVFCCVRNYFRARAANLSAALWAFYTFLAGIIGWFIGSIIVVIIFLMRDPVLREMLKEPKPDREAIVAYLAGPKLIVPEIFLAFCGLGGYLFVRHLIIKRSPLSENTDSVG
jgi:hypothetical protein